MSKVKIIPLGGVRENAKNMYVVEVGNELFICDCGLKYPEGDLLGIDSVIPDFSYLRENAQRIVGVFLTHGHADAIGALPYFVSEFNVPVFGSELTIALAKLYCKGVAKAKKFNDFHVIDDQTEIDFKNATVSFFQTTHSIPESLGIAIKTDQGNVVYTGDFRFDQAAGTGYKTNFARIAEIGGEGVLALLSDSANAENTKPTLNEQEVYERLREPFEYHKGRIIVASISSNILRIQQIFNAAAASERKVVLTGHRVEEIIRTVIKCGKLRLPDDDLLINVNEIDKYDDQQLVILETGLSGEPLKSLQRMAQGRNKRIGLHEGDLVFITTTPAHAVETMLARTKDMIYRAGADVLALADEYNTAGHATRADLQLLMNLLKPKYVFPVQGEYRLLAENARSAVEIGIPEDHVAILSRGDVAEYERGKFVVASSVEAGDTMIDGSGVGDIGNIVLRDRKVLSEDGIFIAVVTIDQKHRRIIDSPQITSRGFVYVKASKELINKSVALVRQVVQANLDNKNLDWSHLKQDIREKLGHYLYEQTHRHPVILPVIMEINQHYGRRRRKDSRSEKEN